jgi:hypothetical protein
VCVCVWQLRYYDGSVDDNPKDVIELKDVVAVAPMKSAGAGAAKKLDDNAFFEVTSSAQPLVTDDILLLLRILFRES